jgi:hypothetical protein
MYHVLGAALRLVEGSCCPYRRGGEAAAVPPPLALFMLRVT